PTAPRSGLAAMTQDDSGLPGPHSDVPLDLDGAFASLNLVGESPVFRQAMRLVRRLAPSDATVLLRGETGTGKEMAARAIHYLSARPGGPLLPGHCGASPQGLVQGRVFG